MSVKSGRRTGKRLLSFLLGLCMMIGLLPVTAMAADQPSYVVLGDSISTGYGLAEGEPSFAARLAEKNNLAMTLLAKDGATSEDLCNVVSGTDNEETIKNADVITITIGGNDMMDALYEYLAEKYNVAYSPDPAWTAEDVKNTIVDEDNENYNKLLFIAAFNIGSFPTSSQAQAQAKSVGTNLSQALAKIKSLNPDVTVIVANQYNPYTHAAEEADELSKSMAEMISQAFQGGIELLNPELVEAASNNNCTVADVAAAIKGAAENPCNASFSGTMNLDFHPNAYGHTLIADTLQPYFESVVQRYSLTVRYGTGSGNHWKGRKVELTANKAPAGRHFVSWEVTPEAYKTYFEDITSPTTTFTMPAAEVQITAVYEAHKLTYHAEVPATCTVSGTKDYWKCSECGGIYSDKDGIQPVTEDDLVIPPLGHNLGKWESNGEKHWQTCGRCSEKLNEAEHSYASEIDSTCDICGYIRDVDPVAVLNSEILFRELTGGVDGTIWDTVDKVKERLISILKEKGYSGENVSFCDAVLTGTLTVNGKVLKEDVDFSAKDTKFTVVIPYPEGTDKDTKDFTVLHMFSASSDVLGTTAGDTETLEPVKLENGLQVTLKGLSPVAVAWSVDSQAGTDAGTNSGTSTGMNAGASAVPETGDRAPIVPLAAVMIVCASVIGFTGYGKRPKNQR